MIPWILFWVEREGGRQKRLHENLPQQTVGAAILLIEVLFAFFAGILASSLLLL